MFPVLTYAKASVAILGIILILPVIAQHAHAQELFRLSLFLDKVTYTPLDESVKVTGCLLSEGSSVLGRLVSVEVHAPDGNVVLVDSAATDSTCNFELAIDTRSLPEHGNYLVVATHESASGKEAFRFSNEINLKQAGECAESYCLYYFELLGQIYPVQYTLSSGKLNSIVVDLPARSLMFLIDPTENAGTMTALLPRQAIDSSQNGTDVRYKVFIGSLTNGVRHVVHEELAADNSTRTVVVDYPASDEQILVSINGTHIAPEFGHTLMVFGALAGSVIVSLRFIRFKFRING
jgi:hypothetical protein